MPTKPKSPLSRPFKLIGKRAFSKMTKHQKRVALARDLLLRLKLKKLRATSGTIMTGVLTTGVTAPQMQVALNKTTSCHVCAKGALLASWIGNFDSVNGAQLFTMMTDVVSTASRFPAGLVEVFGVRLMAALEVAFEGKVHSWNGNTLAADNTDLLIGTFRGLTDDKRLKAVYTNVVRNRGKLVVKDSNGARLVFD